MSKRSPENLNQNPVRELAIEANAFMAELRQTAGQMVLTTDQKVRLDGIMNNFALAIDTTEAEPAVAIGAITMILKNNLRNLTPFEMELIVKHQDLFLEKTAQIYRATHEELEEANKARRRAEMNYTNAMLTDSSAQDMVRLANQWDPETLTFDEVAWEIMLNDIPKAVAKRRFILSLVEKTGGDISAYKHELYPEEIEETEEAKQSREARENTLISKMNQIAIALGHRTRALNLEEIQFLAQNGDLFNQFVADGTQEAGVAENKTYQAHKTASMDLKRWQDIGQLSLRLIRLFKRWNSETKSFDDQDWEVMLNLFNHGYGKQTRLLILQLAQEAGADISEYEEELQFINN